MDKFVTFLHTAWSDFLSWFGVEEQKLASFLYPIFQDGKQIVENDLLTDIIAGVPIVATALSGATGGASEVLAAGLTAAEGFIVPLVEKQGVTLAQTTINTLSNALVAQAQAAQAAVAAPAAGVSS